ncbi:MAG: amidase [Ramlibacter sp.]
MPNELWRLSAAQLVVGYQAGDFSPVEVLAACQARMAATQPAINAFVHVDHAGAQAAAQASAQRWARGEPLGSLDGVPVSLKDNLHAQGLPTSWGSLLTGGFVPAQDELPVARLRAAGAVILGKTNLPEFAMQGYTGNRRWGTTFNPWNTALTAGGSSGGAVAAVAAGCGPLAIGTDGGGSIRRPASHTGLVGFKPSEGCVPRAGGLPELFLGYEVVGPMARTVADVAAALQVLAPGLGALPTAPARARILFTPRFGDAPVDPAIARLTQQAAAQFAALGHHVEEADRFDLPNAVNAAWPTLSATGLAWMMAQAWRVPEFGLAEGQAPDTRLCTPAIQATLKTGQEAPAAAMFALMAAVHHTREQLAGLFARYDYILTPAAAALPWPGDDIYPPQIDGQDAGPRGHAVFTGLANAAGLPAIALPCGMAEGLPVGLQLIGKPQADAALLALAAQYEAAHPWTAHWPPL